MRVLLVVYDNESYIHWFPQGLAYLAAVLLNEGLDVEIYNQDKYHYPDIHLTEFLNNNKFDVIGVGVIGGYYQYKKLLKISHAINTSRQKPFYVIGGHGPSPEPEFFLKKTHADAVVIGEGEVTILELLKALANHASLKTVQGIAFRDANEIVINERRELIADIDSIPWPAYKAFPIEYYRLIRMPYASSTDFLMPVLSGRGCKFKCNFCYRMDDGFRPRSAESIIEEIQFLKHKYGITYVIFSDEMFMSSVERTKELCKAIIHSNINIKWVCSGRLNYAKPEVLNLMKTAGCVYVVYGIEAVDDQVLKNMKKALIVKQITKGIEETLKAGFSPNINIIFGNIGDTRETLEKGVEFFLKYDDCHEMRNIRPVTPYPGSPLYYYAIDQGLLKDCEDFYENKHINSDLISVNFTDLTDDEFHQFLLEANTKLFKNYFNKKLSSVIVQSKQLYLEKDESFRGYRQT